MSLGWLSFHDPLSRQPLCFAPVTKNGEYGYWSAGKDALRWPQALGIIFIRADRQRLAAAAVELILSGHYVKAVGLLLSDTDDFAPYKPRPENCELVAQRLIAGDKTLGAREVMELLQFGPVADYFALRGSAPTFFSGLGLLKLGARVNKPILEVGCGVGHFLYWLAARGLHAVGIDSVFSKLCIAQRFFSVQADHLLCAVAGKDFFLPFSSSRPTSVFCHDAFYFIHDKARALDDFRRLAGAGGSVLIGHTHLANADHGRVAGYPLSLAAYRELAAPSARFYDDADLVGLGFWNRPPSHAISASAEAIAFIENGPNEAEIAERRASEELLHAPLGLTWSPTLRRTVMQWPDAAFAKEYESSDYLESSSNVFELLPSRSSSSETSGLHPSLAIPTPFFALGAKPLRWGVIGGGWIATDYFIPAFRYSPHAQLIALADVNTQRRETHTTRSGFEVFEDWQKMISGCRLDAVYIATPNDRHAEIFEGCARAGLRILCEKPVVTNLADLERIKAVSCKNPERFQAAFDQRYHPAHLQIARRLAEGVLGTVTQIRIHYACWVDDAWKKVPATENWRVDRKKAGGGAGFDLLPHCIDLITFLVNEPVAQACLFYQGKIHQYAIENEVDDGAIMVLKTKNSILASLHVGYNCPEDQPRRRIEIIGTSGRVEALNTMGQDPGGELIWSLAAGEERVVFPAVPEAGPFARQLDAISRLWLRRDSPQFPFMHDLELAALLIRCDSEAHSRA